LHGRIIVRRHKEILTRKRYIKITDGECYFYNRLLQIRAWRSEDEIYGGYDTYRERYLSMFSSERQILREETRSYITHMRSQLTSQFNEIVNSLIISLQQQLSLSHTDLLCHQLQTRRSFYSFPPTTTKIFANPKILLIIKSSSF